MRRYFEEEMRYLHEAGKVFAEAHPEQARYLNIDSLTDRDPYVERLFEGFAFLAGRIHERLDDEFQEYTDGLFSLLYPHFLRPIPALSIAEFHPVAGQLSQPLIIKRGTPIESEAVGPERTVCRFVTSEDIVVRPLTLTDTTLDVQADGSHTLKLAFRVGGGANLPESSLSPLRLYLHADPSIASILHMFLTQHVENVRAYRGDASPDLSPIELSGSRWIVPAGLDESEGLLPYSKYTFTGVRLLQEYFSFRQKFWSVDLLGLGGIGTLDGGATFSVHIKFDREYPQDKRFGDKTFRLHTSPVINLFESDVQPIRVTHTDSEHRVVADPARRSSIEVYDILRVVGVEEKTGVRNEYGYFYDFKRSAQDAGRYYVQSFRRGADDRRATYVSLINGRADANLEPEVLSIRARCTNGTLPREKLQERMLTKLGEGAAAVVEPSNLIRPTLIRYPPSDARKEYFWTLLSHLSLNHVSLGSREGLTAVLRLYDWSESDANRRRIDGIRDVRWEAKDITQRGGVVRGAEVVVEIDETHFPDDGDICLFGLVLSEFLSMYASLNSFVHLKITTVPSERTFEWKPTRGRKSGI